MKRSIFGIAAAAILATSSFGADYVMKISHVVSSSTPKGMAADFLEKRIEELTAGKIDVQVFPNSQLYGDADEMKALAMNNVQLIMPSLSKFPSKKQMIAFDYWDAGFKHFSSSKKAIINPEDAKGQKFRIQSSKVLEAQFKAVGGNPQILPFSEVYSALQQGVVDATENPLSNFYTKKFNEVQSSLTLSSHGYLGYLVVMNQQFWDKLPKDVQEKVSQAMKEATEFERKATAEDDAKIMANLKKYAAESKRLEIFELNDAQKANWRKVMEGIYPQFYDVIGEDLIKKAIDTK